MIRFPRGKLRRGRFRNSVQAYRSGLDRTGRSRDSLSSVDYRVSRNEIERARIASSTILMRSTIQGNNATNYIPAETIYLNLRSIYKFVFIYFVIL